MIVNGDQQKDQPGGVPANGQPQSHIHNRHHYRERELKQALAQFTVKGVALLFRFRLLCRLCHSSGLAGRRLWRRQQRRFAT